MYQINSKISRSFRLNRGTVVMDDIRTKGTSFSERLKLAPLNPMSLSTQDLWRPVSQKHAVTVTLLQSKLWTKSLPKKGRFPRFESRKLMNCRQVYEKYFKLLGSKSWLFWRKGSWSLATGPIKSDPNHTCGWYTLVLVISLVEVGLW